jgi:predicted ATP-grasp superfamily ATP-dependent carboligase
LRQHAVLDEQVLRSIPDVSLPIVQPCSENSERIYTVNGYFDDESGFHPSMACAKILQRPRGSGAGIIFEHVEVDREIHESLGTLFRTVGFRGVYDVEFLEAGSRRMLIDVNPRFYNHMAFEVERGLHLPWFAHLAASRQRELLGVAISEFSESENSREVYVHRLPTAMLLLAQGIASRMTPDERHRWRRFITTHKRATTNPARTPEDPRPEIVEVAMELRDFLRHPRAYVQALVRGPT